MDEQGESYIPFKLCRGYN